MAVAIPFFIANLGVFSAEVGIEGKTANKKAASKDDIEKYFTAKFISKVCCRLKKA